MSSDLNFLYEEPAVPFRVVKRKGEMRYIASNQRGSLAAITRFAPPTKSLPKLFLRLGAAVDFRLPGLASPLPVSIEFLEQAAGRLNIPVERIGIYVGEPNDRRKLVICDVENESNWILKLAVGSEAEAAILRELASLQAVSRDLLAVNIQSGAPCFFAPSVREVDPLCGHAAILIERVQGKQLTPEEFEAAFCATGTGDWVQGSGVASRKGTENTELITVKDWFNESRVFSLDKNSVRDALTRCCKCGALDLRSSVGVVHGDFAPWNILCVGKEKVTGFRMEADKDSPTTNNRSANNCQSRYCAIDWEFSRADTPLIFDYAYVAWCYSKLLDRRIAGIDDERWNQLVALGALWKELRPQLQLTVTSESCSSPKT